VLFATSEVSEALSVSNRIVVMSKGRIIRVLDSASATREDLMVASGEATEDELSRSEDE